MPSPSRTMRPSRRDLLAGSLGAAAFAASAATAAGLPAGGLFAAGSDRIRIGLIGCGGRGTGAAAQAASLHPGVVIAALGDLFADHLAETAAMLAGGIGVQFDCPSNRRFVGQDAWRQLVDSDLDAVILAAAPWSRPAHVKAAVARGLHIYCERPAATDAAGVREVLAAFAEAERRGLVIVSGLASRHHGPTARTIQHIHAGGIGSPLRAVCRARVGASWQRPPRPEWTAEECRHRNWVADPSLAGGLLVERHLDAIDRGLWALGDACPVAAMPIGSAVPIGSAGRAAAAVRYRFADGRELVAEIEVGAGGQSRTEDRVVGTLAAAELGGHRIRGSSPVTNDLPGKNPWLACMGGFVDAIVSGGRGDGGEALCRSTLVAMLGEAAVRSGREMSWRDTAGPATDAIATI